MATIEQLLIALPFMRTVQAPHCAVSQPTWVPVRRRCSRMKVTRSVRASTSAETALPLTFMDTLTAMLPPCRSELFAAGGTNILAKRIRGGNVALQYRGAARA